MRKSFESWCPNATQRLLFARTSAPSFPLVGAPCCIFAGGWVKLCRSVNRLGGANRGIDCTCTGSESALVPSTPAGSCSAASSRRSSLSPFGSLQLPCNGQLVSTRLSSSRSWPCWERQEVGCVLSQRLQVQLRACECTPMQSTGFSEMVGLIAAYRLLVLGTASPMAERKPSTRTCTGSGSPRGRPGQPGGKLSFVSL